MANYLHSLKLSQGICKDTSATDNLTLAVFQSVTSSPSDHYDYFYELQSMSFKYQSKELNFKDSENVPIGEMEKFNSAIKLRITFYFSRIIITRNVLNYKGYIFSIIRLLFHY